LIDNLGGDVLMLKITDSKPSSSEKLRIAVVLSGLPRMWRACVDSQKMLLTDIPADIDFFFHFWDSVDESEKIAIRDSYKPLAWTFEPYRSLDHWNHRNDLQCDNINVPARMVSQYTSWQESLRLLTESKAINDYDIIVRIRSDLMFFQPLGGLIKNCAKRFIFLTSHNDFGIVNDMFAIGDSVSMAGYLNLIDSIEAYKSSVIFNPELLLRHHLLQIAKTGVEIRSFNIPILVVREHMVGKTIAECMNEHPGQNKWLDRDIIASFQAFHAKRHGEMGVQHLQKFMSAQLEQMQNLKR
jgi:hypothetical protein